MNPLQLLWCNESDDSTDRKFQAARLKESVSSNKLEALEKTTFDKHEYEYLWSITAKQVKQSVTKGEIISVTVNNRL